MPQLKQDELVDVLSNLMMTGEKALVFTRRIASVNELEAKLLDTYSEFLFNKIQAFYKKLFHLRK